MLSLHTWEKLWDPAGGYQGWANPWHPAPSPTHTKCSENLKKAEEKPPIFKQLMKKKQEYHGIPPQASSSRSSCSPQGEGAAQRFGETKSSSCSWALGSSQRCSQGTAPHRCVPVFSFWEQGWQVVLVSHPRQPLSPAERFHPVLKTPQLLPQQPWLLPVPTGKLGHTKL